MRVVEQLKQQLHRWNLAYEGRNRVTHNGGAALQYSGRLTAGA